MFQYCFEIISIIRIVDVLTLQLFEICCWHLCSSPKAVIEFIDSRFVVLPFWHRSRCRKSISMSNFTGSHQSLNTKSRLLVILKIFRSHLLPSSDAPTSIFISSWSVSPSGVQVSDFPELQISPEARGERTPACLTHRNKFRNKCHLKRWQAGNRKK